MNLSKYETTVIITYSPVLLTDPDGKTFKYETVYAIEREDLKDPPLDVIKKYSPNSGDKLYFYQGCDVPRYKVREWAKNKNISITTDEDKATHIITGKKTYNSFFESGYLMSCDKEGYIRFLDLNFKPSIIIDLLKDEINKSTNSKILIDKRTLTFGHSACGYAYSSYIHTTKDVHGVNKFIGDITGGWNTWNDTVYIKQKNHQRVLKIFDPSSIVYSEQSLIELINENSAIIDKPMYEQIKTMFKSANSDDRVLALSIMSNCNVKPSLYFLLLLIQEFSHIIVSLKESKHVNFKSLLNYLNLPNWEYLSVDDIIQCLLDKDELTMNIITEIAEIVKNNMQNSHNTKHFKINSITVSDEVKEYILQKTQN